MDFRGRIIHIAPQDIPDFDIKSLFSQVSDASEALSFLNVEALNVILNYLETNPAIRKTADNLLVIIPEGVGVDTSLLSVLPAQLKLMFGQTVVGLSLLQEIETLAQAMIQA
jgi:UDP-N-acetyl-D-mannosaminuronic acid transferase (WecB/TagA/CpsF family)